MQLTKEYLQRGLATSTFGRKLYTFDEIDSTNSCVRALADVGAEEGTVVVAEFQTEGRGRLGRSWSAEPGANLLFSVLIRPPFTREQAGILPFFAAVAITRAVEPTLGRRVESKWPNDLLIGGKKFCGILLETATQDQRLLHAILGIGINVNQRTFPAELALQATSLACERAHPVDRKALLHTILREMESLYETARSGSSEPILAEWLSRCTMIGKKVSVRSGDEVIQGTAVEVRETGALVIQTPSGQNTYFAADVTMNNESLPHPRRS